MITSHEYPNLRRKVYGHGPDDELHGAHFIPVCGQCGRFVTADPTMTWRFVADSSYVGGYYEPVTPNASCTKCGRTAMIWEGFY